VLIDHAFGAQEIGRLAEIAAEAEENHLPVIASLAASALGLSRLGDFGSISDLGGAMAANAEWTALRGSEASRWLALVLNGFLLRFPYGAETDPTAGLDFEENPPGEEPVYLWGRPGWILGALLTDSFARTGWGAGITGPQSGGRMDDLPVRLIQRPPRELVQIPLETLLPENRLLEISLAGIIPLACKRNSDAAFVMTAPTVRLPQGKDAEERRREAQRTTLPFQMMTVQILGTVEAWLAEADPKSEPSLLAASLAAAFRRASPLLDVSAGSSVGAGGKPRLVLNARPVGDPLKGLPDVQLDFTLPGP
jgi:type VI secretion system ImpC/EvpB family protein